VDHVGRSANDTYYLNKSTLLRYANTRLAITFGACAVGLRLAISSPPLSYCRRSTHTSAHQAELMRSGERQFLVTGDVYRRDAIDKTHYPVRCTPHA